MRPSFLRTTLVSALAVSTAVAPIQPALAQASYVFKTQVPDLKVVEFSQPSEAQLSVSTGSVAFGSVGVGQVSEVRSVVIENLGKIPASLGTGFVVSGAGFSGTSNCPSLLASGAQCAVAITFAPTVEGASNGTLTYPGAPAPLPVTLTGTGLGPGASLAPDATASTSFGQVPVFTVKTNAYVFRNTGGTTLTGVQASLTGSDLSFTANTCGTQAAPVSLAAGATCTMSVKFEPQAADSVTGQLSVTSSAPNSPHTLELTAEGTASGRLVTVSPAVGGKTLYDLDTELLSFSSAGTWTVTPVTSFNIAMKAWGGGGGSIINYKSTTGYGGAGGFAAGGYAATARQPLVVNLPAKGGLQGTGQWVAGAADGGAYAGVFLGTVSRTNSLVVAGGGGGAMANGHGSANGGAAGQNGANSSWSGINSYCPSTRLYGSAGTTSAGGLGGQPYNTNYVLPQDGSGLAGGNGGGWGAGVAPYGSGQAWDWTMGAGGGGGYFGGGGSAGGGGCAGSAGGGSSFVAAGLNNPLVINGSGTTAGNSADPHRGTAGDRDTFVGKVVFAPYSAPSVSLSTSNLSLGAGTVGAAATSQSVLVLNSGGTLGTVSSISVSGTDAAAFSATTNCSGYVQANGSCAVTVSFAPTTAGEKSASLNVQTSSGLLTVALSGTGQELTTSGSGAFGSVHVGDATATKTLSLFNSGTGPVTVSNIAVSGTNASLFTTSTSSCTGVVASSPCTVTVSFKPVTAVAGASATLTFTTPAGTRTVALSGSGVDIAVGQGLSTTAAGSATVTPGSGLSLSNATYAKVFNGSTEVATSTSVSWGGSSLTVNFNTLPGSITSMRLYDSSNAVIASGSASAFGARILTVSPAVSGKTTWNLDTDGPLILSTSGTWTVTPTNAFAATVKLWGAGGGAGGFDAGANYAGNGGGAAYVGGTWTVAGSTAYTLRVGGGGGGGASSVAGTGGGAGGFNGGGSGAAAGPVGTSGGGGGGGGRTEIVQGSTIHACAGAGGGGGGDGNSGTNGANDGNSLNRVLSGSYTGGNAARPASDGGGNGGGGGGCFAGDTYGSYPFDDANGTGGAAGRNDTGTLTGATSVAAGVASRTPANSADTDNGGAGTGGARNGGAGSAGRIVIR